MIGLERHTVRLDSHASEWPSLAAAEMAAIRLAGEPLIRGLEHVGSTSVPGLPAKPILDLALAVTSRSALPELIRRMTAIGYLDRGDGGTEGGWLLVKESRPEVRTVHLHVVEPADPQWRQYLCFRDLLRRDAGIRDAYRNLKENLAAQYPNDRPGYTRSKAAFIQRVLKEHAAA